MQPIVNNNEPPKPADLNELSADAAQPRLGASAEGSNADNPNTPEGVTGGKLTTQDVIKFAKGRNAAFEKWFGPKIKDMEKWHRLWRNGMPITKGGKIVPLPVGHSILESVNARLAASVLNRPKYVEAVAEMPGQDNAAQKLVGDFVNQQLGRIVPQQDRGKAAVKSALLESFVILRSVWRQDVTETLVPITEPDVMTGEPVIVGEQVQQVMKERWDFEPKNPGNMAFDPHCQTKLQDSKWVRERSRMSYNELLAWQREGRIGDVSMVKRLVPSGLGGAEKENWEDALKKADGDKEWSFTYGDEKQYQVDEWFAHVTYEDADQTKVCNCHFFVVEGSHVVYFEENQLDPKRHPYISCPLLIDPRSIVGVNILEPVEPLLQQINDYSTKQAAIVESFSNPVIFYDESSGLQGRATIAKLNGMIPVQNAQGIREFVRDPGALSAVTQYVNELTQIAREATGANDQFQGIDGSDTATEFQGLQAAAGSRFADIADTLNQGMMEGLANECRWMYVQFGVDGEMCVHPVTEQGPARPITRADLAGEYQFKAISSISEGYKGKQIADDTAFIAEVGQLNRIGAFGSTPYNLQKHIMEVSLPLRGQKTSADMFIQAPPPVVGMGAPAGAAPSMAGAMPAPGPDIPGGMNGAPSLT